MNHVKEETIICQVLDQLNISRRDAHSFSITKEEDYFHMFFSDDFVNYEIYFDSRTEEIAGINTVPAYEENFSASTCDNVA